MIAAGTKDSCLAQQPSLEAVCCGEVSAARLLGGVHLGVSKWRRRPPLAANSPALGPLALTNRFLVSFWLDKFSSPLPAIFLVDVGVAGGRLDANVDQGNSSSLNKHSYRPPLTMELPSSSQPLTQPDVKHTRPCTGLGWAGRSPT